MRQHLPHNSKTIPLRKKSVITKNGASTISDNSYANVVRIEHTDVPPLCSTHMAFRQKLSKILLRVAIFLVITLFLLRDITYFRVMEMNVMFRPTPVNENIRHFSSAASFFFFGRGGRRPLSEEWCLKNQSGGGCGLYAGPRTISGTFSCWFCIFDFLIKKWSIKVRKVNKMNFHQFYFHKCPDKLWLLFAYLPT